MTQEEKDKIMNYLYSLPTPVEKSFFNSEQIAKIEQERQKYESTIKFIETIVNKDNFEELLSKANIEGRVYSPAEAVNVRTKLEVIDDAYGARIDPSESIVTKTGQQIIMSGKLQEILGFLTDGYLLNDEIEELQNALHEDGVVPPEIDKVTAAMNQYGAIRLQRGVFISLKAMLEDSLGKTLSIYNPVAPTQLVEVSTPTSPSVATKVHLDLPSDLTEAFVEYVKHNEKDFSHITQSIIADPKFADFFANLKINYAHYRDLPESKMVEEIIQHPRLWIKLSDEVGANVRDMVEKNWEAFHKKPKTPEKTPDHGLSINDLKARLSGSPTGKSINFADQLKKQVNTPELSDQPSAIPEEHKPKAPRRAAEKKDSKTAWMLSNNVVAPKQQGATGPRAPKRIPKVRSHVARFGLDSLDHVREMDDLTKIEAAHLRQGPLAEQISYIKSLIIQMAKENSLLPANVIPVFDKSPLIQIYLQAGAMLIEKNAGMEDKLVLDEVMAELEDMGQDTLTQEEFEAVADLKKDLSTMAGI